MRFFRYCLLPVLLSAALARPAAAQTARIAHFSHSGSAATLDAAVDNFGIYRQFETDSIRVVSDTTAEEYGRWNYSSDEKVKVRVTKFASHQSGYSSISAQEFVRRKQKQWPKVRVLGFDTVQAASPKPEVPALKKQKTKRKKSAFLPTTAPAPPQHPGVALTVAAILVLTGAGWLLGERKARPQPAV